MNPQFLRSKETSQECTGLPSKDETVKTTLKEVFAKNERGYRLNEIKKALLIATNLTSICRVYKEKNVKDVSYRIT